MLTARERSRIQKAIAELQKLLDSSHPDRPVNTHVPKGRASRRSRKDAGGFRNKIKAAYGKGARVADLAAKHGVTSSYLYQIIRAH
jgi:hypothetical protein